MLTSQPEEITRDFIIIILALHCAIHLKAGATLQGYASYNVLPLYCVKLFSTILFHFYMSLNFTISLPACQWRQSTRKVVFNKIFFNFLFYVPKEWILSGYATCSSKQPILNKMMKEVLILGGHSFKFVVPRWRGVGEGHWASRVPRPVNQNLHFISL